MKQRNRNLLFYAITIGLGSLFIYMVALKGTLLETGDILHSSTERSQWGEFVHTLGLNFLEPLAILLAQILTIIIAARFFGWVFKKIGQPAVIGEVIAGIVLGPSLIGAYFPDFFGTLFPEYSLDSLKILSSIGLVLFMFVVGMELDLKVLKTKVQEAVVISHAGIIYPFALGMGLAYFLYESYSPTGVPFLSFALFMGISMSITAFPVLARIVQEKGINRTKLGTVILTCAAVDDITAWCLLAVVIAIVKAGSVLSSFYTILFAIGYVILMIKVIKPFLKRIGELHSTKERLNKSIVALFFMVLIASAFCTEVIGIHALFGAFMAGVVMPDNKAFRHLFVEKVEDVGIVLLLPLFFVYTGLRTKIGLLDTPELWVVAGWIILVAVIGKFVGSAAAARFVSKQSWRESLMVGALMNTRGLMELVVINIGYDLGVLTPEVFAMMVIMALVTTFMTAPSLSLIDRIFPEKEKKQQIIIQQAEGVFRAVISLGNVHNAKSLINVAKTVLESKRNALEVTVLHMTVGSNMNPMYEEQFTEENFRPVVEVANKLNLPIETSYGITDDLENDIMQFVNSNQYDFLLMGAGLAFSKEPFFRETALFNKIPWMNKFANFLFKQRTIIYPSMLIKDKTRYFIEHSNCSVGVFVNRNFQTIGHTIIIIHSKEDLFLLRYARRLMMNNEQVTIDIEDVNQLSENLDDIAFALNDITQLFPDRVKRIGNGRKYISHYSRYSFMLISYPTWDKMLQEDKDSLSKIPSTLIINKKMSRFTTGRYKQN